MFTFCTLNKNRIWRGGLLVLGGLVGVGLVVWALWCIPSWQVEQVRGRLDKPADEYRLATLEDEHRRTLAQILTGGGLLVGLYLGWRRVRAAEEGQITDRFTKAIEQLGQKGPDNMALRLGGIYALERISKDSEKDHRPIMEVLTAYVRENAPKQGKYVEEANLKPNTDIQAILTVIGHRKTTEIKRLDDFLDLSNTHLAGVHLEQANLSGLSLAGANLTGAMLFGANLNVTALGMADLTRAMLGGAENLTAKEVQSAENWREAYLPEDLQYLKDLPDPPA